MTVRWAVWVLVAATVLPSIAVLRMPDHYLRPAIAMAWIAAALTGSPFLMGACLGMAYAYWRRRTGRWHVPAFSAIAAYLVWLVAW